MRKSSTTSLTASLRKLIIPQRATTPKVLKFLQNNFKKRLTKDRLCVIIKTEKRKGETKMTKNEIKERIDRLEDLKFYLNMKDRWTTEDYRTMSRYRREIQELKKQLEAA